MLPNFEATVLALGDTLVRWRAADCDARTVAAVHQFLMGVHRRMPAYLRLPFVMLGVAFDGSTLFLFGKPFHELGPVERARRIEAWRKSRFEVCRRYVEYYSALTTFGLYSELYAEDYVNPVESAQRA